MATITSLSTLAKTSVGANDYLLIANAAVPDNYKLLTQDLFPSVTTLGTSSEPLFISITNKNTLNFKGIQSLNSLLTVATASNNITLQVDPANIDLSLCNNATSQFFSGSVNLATSVTGTLPVANGGTGLTTLASNSLYVGNGTSALTALGVATNGQIPIGRTGLSPVLANLTAGANVTITNGIGTITIDANLSVLTANLNASTYNIFGTGWLSGDGNNEGIKIDSSGRVFVGSSTPTAFYTYDLNINNSIALNGSTVQRIEMTSSATPSTLSISGASASVSNVNGGTVTVNSGNASGTGNAGQVSILGGAASGSGFGGQLNITGGTSTTNIAGAVSIVGGAASSTGTGGSVVLQPGASTSGTNGKVQINTPLGSTNAPLVNFVGTAGAASANSFSTLTTETAGLKTGAIRIQINGVDAWIRVYSSGA